MSDCKALTIIEVPRAKYPWATDQEVIDALYAHDFHVAETAAFFGVKRRELQARINATPELLLEVEDYNETALDDAERHYVLAARKGNKEAVAGLLNARGRNRGFGKQDKALENLIEVVVRQIGRE